MIDGIHEYYEIILKNIYPDGEYDQLTEEEKQNIIDEIKKQDADKARKTVTDSLPYLRSNMVLVRGHDLFYDLSLGSFMSKAAAKNMAYSCFPIWLSGGERLTVDLDHVVFDASQPSGLYDDVSISGENSIFLNLFNEKKLPRVIPRKEVNNEAVNEISGLLHRLCNYDSKLIDWVEKWLAFPIQNRGSKMKTSILAASPICGTGKNLFFENMIGRCYGGYFGVIGQNELHMNYNDWLSQKLYIVADEVVEAGNDDRFKLKGKIKSMVTADKFSISEKFKPSRIERNQVNLVFLSNERSALALDSNDRRITLIKPEIKENIEYYKKLVRVIQDDWQSYHRYLYDLNVNDVDLSMLPCETKERQELIESEDSSIVRFMREWLAGDTKYEVDICYKKDMYSAYVEWCSEVGERARPNNRFFAEAKEFIYSRPCQDWHGRRVWVCWPKSLDKKFNGITYTGLDLLSMAQWLKGGPGFAGSPRFDDKE
jgi:hypothetical protein